MLGQTAVETLEEGVLIAGRYRVEALIGQGGMGSVYRVLDETLHESCALKVMHPQLLLHEKAQARFLEEARISLRLTHAGIVRIRDIGAWVGRRYLTMELLEGQSLREWLAQLEKEGRRVPVEAAASIALQMLDALSYAHATTIHRDIKPENIFLEGEPPEFRVKLLDFGIAKLMDRGALTTTSVKVGTAWYMAPEQRSAALTVDARADLFAVGVVLYEMLTGSVPSGRFAAPSKKHSDLVDAWDAVVFCAMEEDPEDRYLHAAAMRDAIGIGQTAQSEADRETQQTQRREADDERRTESRKRKGSREGESRLTREKRGIADATETRVTNELPEEQSPPTAPQPSPEVGSPEKAGHRIVTALGVVMLAMVLFSIAIMLSWQKGENEREREARGAVVRALDREDLESATRYLAEYRRSGGDETAANSLQRRLEALNERMQLEVREQELNSLISRIEIELRADRFEQARRLLESYQANGGDPSTERSLSRRIDEREDALTREARLRRRQEEEAAADQELSSLLSQVDRALASDNLTEARTKLETYLIGGGEPSKYNSRLDRVENRQQELSQMASAAERPGQDNPPTLKDREMLKRLVNIYEESPAGESGRAKPQQRGAVPQADLESLLESCDAAVQRDDFVEATRFLVEYGRRGGSIAGGNKAWRLLAKIQSKKKAYRLRGFGSSIVKSSAVNNAKAVLFVQNGMAAELEAGGVVEIEFEVLATRGFTIYLLEGADVVLSAMVSKDCRTYVSAGGIQGVVSKPRNLDIGLGSLESARCLRLKGNGRVDAVQAHR